MGIKDTAIVRTYFRGRRKFGRTTTLVNRHTGEKLIEVMGVATRKDCWSAHLLNRRNIAKLVG